MKRYLYHIVDCSPWPLFSKFLTIGFVLFLFIFRNEFFSGLLLKNNYPYYWLFDKSPVNAIISVFFHLNEKNIEGGKEKKFYSELQIKGNNIFWMKLNEILKKSSFKTKKSREYYMNRSNRNFSRIVQVSEEGKEEVLNNIITSKWNNNINNSKYLQKQLKTVLDHPTIIDIKDENNNIITISITNLTTKDKSIFLNGKKIDVAFVGEFNGRKQFLVKAIWEVKINKNNLKEGFFLQSNDKFNFNDRINEQIVNNSKQILDNYNKVTTIDTSTNNISVGVNSITDYENKTDFFNKFQ